MPKRKAAKPKTADGFSDHTFERIVQETLEKEQSRESVLRWMDVQCPHCGEDFEVCVDPSEEGHEMVQDCQVCCKAVQLSVEVEDGEVAVFAYRS